MKNRLLLLALALAGCGPAIDPANPSSLISPLMLEPPPIYSLIGFRTDLELTSEQVEALDSIAQAVQAETQPLLADLRQQAAQQSRRYRGAIPVSDLTRPAILEVREKNRAAVRAVEDLLTPEQETEVCRLLDLERREDRSRNRDRDRPASRRPSAMGADSLLFHTGPVWSWCGPGTVEG